MYKLPRSLPKAKAQAEAEATAEAEAEAEVEAAAVEVAARTKYACCASQSSKTAWQCNGPCGLWFHEPCMKKCGDPSNYLGVAKRRRRPWRLRARSAHAFPTGRLATHEHS